MRPMHWPARSPMRSSSSASLPLRQRVLPQDEGHGGLSRRPWLAHGGPYPGPQRPPQAQRSLRSPPDVEHPSAALPHLPAGPRRPRHGGAPAGSFGHIGLRAMVLDLLDCSRRYSPTASVHTVAAAGDVVQVVGATRRRHLHRVHPGHPSTTHGQGASPCGRSSPPAAMLAGAPPGFPSATPWAAPPSAYSMSTWPGPAGWDQAALANSFSTIALTLSVGPE